MQITDEMVEAAARSDAEFDKRGWLEMPKHERERYLARGRKSLTAANAAAWRPVKDGLPEIGRVVLVSYNSGFNDEPVLAFGARIDTDEGWLWGIQTGYSGGVDPNEDATWNEIDADDEYKVTHWQPLTAPPATPEASE